MTFWFLMITRPHLVHCTDAAYSYICHTFHSLCVYVLGTPLICAETDGTDQNPFAGRRFTWAKEPHVSLDAHWRPREYDWTIDAAECQVTLSICCFSQSCVFIAVLEESLICSFKNVKVFNFTYSLARLLHASCNKLLLAPQISNIAYDSWVQRS